MFLLMAITIKLSNSLQGSNEAQNRGTAVLFPTATCALISSIHILKTQEILFVTIQN